MRYSPIAMWLILNVVIALAARLSESALLYSDGGPYFWSMKLCFIAAPFILALTVLKARIGWFGRTFAVAIFMIGQWKALQTGFAFTTWAIRGFAP